MNILLSNDDGIDAGGLTVLTEELSKKHNVYVVAPDRERSAAGHSLTLHTPLRVDYLGEDKNGAKKTWITNGTPGDCIKIALSAILEKEEKPDLIISGINHGPNLGVEILYSGTVSCAVEGSILGIPSIAVSLATLHCSYEDFIYPAKFISSLLDRIMDFKFPLKTILNINIPKLPKEELSGVSITTLGQKLFTDTYEKRTDPRGKTYYWLAGELKNEKNNEKTDFTAIRNNRISITPITYEMTKHDTIPTLEEILCNNQICDWY